MHACTLSCFFIMFCLYLYQFSLYLQSNINESTARALHLLCEYKL